MEKNKLCRECKKNGHDSDSNHLFKMSDGQRWCCTHRDYHESGEVYYEDAEGNKIDGSKDNSISNLLATLGMKDSPAKEIPEEMFTLVPQEFTGKREDIREAYRGILPDTFKYYGTQGEYSSSGDLAATIDAVYEADTNKHLVDKMRKLPKTIFTTSKLPDKAKVQFFGQQVAKSSKKLLITEGEYDALSAYQMFQASKYCKGVQVISLPFGANVKAFVDNPKFLKMYKEIYVAVDQDDAGKRVSREIASIIPHAKFLFFSEKDANKMLTENKADEFINALFSAEVYRPDTIVTVSDVIDKVMEKPVMGDPWPWPTLTAKTYGRNPGQGIYVGAGVKIGKSEFINEVVSFDISRGKKIAVLKYEEPPFITVKRIAGKQDGIFYHKPGVVYKDADLMATAKAMEPLLLMYPAFGQANWETTKDFIRYAALTGCETIIIDPVTKLTNGLTPSDTETALRTLSDELACMSQDLGFFYIVTCHLKTPISGPPHERGGKVQSSQFRGSRSMMENTFYMLGIERNKDPELSEEEQNTSTFVLLEDRNFGESCSFRVYYNKINQSYREPVANTNF